MNIADLYPDPPHLSLSVWTPAPEAETFASVCRAIETTGGTATGFVFRVPAGAEFEWHYELHESHPGPEDVGARFDLLVRGDDAQTDVIQAGYLQGAENLMVVERAPGPRDETHPVRALMHDALWLPIDLWTDEDRQNAASFTAWLLPLFRQIVSETSALYGVIESEAEQQTPSQLLDGSPITGDLYVSDALLNDDPELLPDLRHIRRDTEEQNWPTGAFLPGYGPFRTDQITQSVDHALDGARAMRLGEAVRRYLDRPAREP